MKTSPSRSDVQTAPDGSPVELYALLPPDGEPEVIHAAVPRGATLLELGCGAGRVTHALIALGHTVVAVDESPAMLAHVRGAETVQSTIEALDLGRRFDGVVLGSYLVNMPHDAQRAAFLRTCRRHVAPDGVVLIERHHPAWASALTECEFSHNGVWCALRAVRHEGTLLSAVLEYRIAGRGFTHPFTARILNDAALETELRAAGLHMLGGLDSAGRWVAAAPVPVS